MKAKTTLLSLLLLSAVCAAPAYANYFSDPRTGVNLNVGSAPSPTVEQLRAIGDSVYGPSPPRYYRGRVYRQRDSEDSVDQALLNMEGRPVFGEGGSRLGYVLAVDGYAQTIDLRMPSGVAISMPVKLIMERSGRLVAPTVSRADAREMAREQWGPRVAVN